jgi:hypothetical protein
VWCYFIFWSTVLSVIMKIKELTVLLFLESIGGIHRQFHLASKKKKILLIIRIAIDLSSVASLVTSNFIMPTNNNTYAKVSATSNLLIFIYFVSISLFPIKHSNIFCELNDKICLLQGYYKDKSKSRNTIDATKIILLMITTLMVLGGGIRTIFRLISHKVEMESYPKEASKIYKALWNIFYQYRYFLEHYMFCSVISYIGEIIEHLTSSIERVIEEIIIKQERRSLVDNNTLEIEEANDLSLEVEVERWSAHYRMIISCSNLLNVCFSKQVK